MASGSIKVNTDQVEGIARTIEGLNAQLLDELKAGQASIKQLSSFWEGEAATATISAFDEFSAKYFQNYHDILQQYVDFLKLNVAQGYFEAETINTGLSDQFK